MKFLSQALVAILAMNIIAPSLRAVDYDNGVIVLNENQYGKADSSINHLSLAADGAGTWDYGIFDSANPGKRLGNTAVSGAYAAGKLLVVCKQASISGSSEQGGGVVSCMDATSMQSLWQMETLGDPALRASGRGCLALSDTKAYVSSSNGIWVIDVNNGTATGPISGTENPYGVDNKPITDPTSSQYFGQCGSMVFVNGMVFAAHQEYGILVIDPRSDTLLHTISTESLAAGSGIGSVVAGSDGNVWLSLSDTKDGMGYTLPMLGYLDPATLTLSSVELPSDMFGPSTSWAAWTPDTFCASPEGYLYWTGGEDNWYANKLVYRFNVTTRSTELLIDYNDDPSGWIVNTPSMRVDPATGNLWMTLFKDFGSKKYNLRSLTSAGVTIRDYPMKDAYWFCGTILFPASEIASVQGVKADFAAPRFAVAYSAGTLSVSGATQGASLEVFDLFGRKAAASVLTESSAIFRMSLSPGIYVARCGAASAKFVAR